MRSGLRVALDLHYRSFTTDLQWGIHDPNRTSSVSLALRRLRRRLRGRRTTRAAARTGAPAATSAAGASAVTARRSPPPPPRMATTTRACPACTAGCHLIGNAGAGAPEYTLRRHALQGRDRHDAVRRRHRDRHGRRQTYKMVAAATDDFATTGTPGIGNFFIPKALATPPTAATTGTTKASACPNTDADGRPARRQRRQLQQLPHRAGQPGRGGPRLRPVALLLLLLHRDQARVRLGRGCRRRSAGRRAAAASAPRRARRAR